MEQTRYDVFISYSTIDKLIAEAVCGYLESNRVRCFVAYRDIPKGDDWAQAIPPALRGSRMMLAVFSQAFNMSEQTDNELHIAAHRKIPILTFRITEDDFDGAKEYFLAKSNWIDAFPEPEKQFGELLRSVQVLLGIKVEPKEENASYAKKDVEEQGLEVETKFREAMALLDPSLGVNRDKLRGAYCLRKVAEEGLPEAECQMGLCYLDGIGVSQSWKDSMEWFSKGVSHGHPRAMRQLAMMHHYGMGTVSNIMKALDLYTGSADAGDGVSMKYLGRFFHSGELGVFDEERSKRYYEMALQRLMELSIENEDSEAQCELGFSYLDGEGVPLDQYYAVEWFRRAVEKCYPPAINAMAICYRYGWGVKKDRRKEFEMKLQAGELDFRVAQNSTGNNYIAGIGCDVDVALGNDYRKRAASGGCVMAQNDLAYDYQYGNNIERDERMADYWFERAIEGGSLGAMYNYATKKMGAEDVSNEDKRLAFTLYKRASIMGYVPAYASLGNCYFYGTGTEKNDVEAYRWYTKLLEEYKKMVERREMRLSVPTGGSSFRYTDFKGTFKSDFINMCDNLLSLYVKDGKTKEYDILKGIKTSLQKEESDHVE